VNQWNKKPFFSRLLPAFAVYLAASALFALIAQADRLVTNPLGWKPESRAPLTVRQALVLADGRWVEKFVVKRGHPVTEQIHRELIQMTESGQAFEWPDLGRGFFFTLLLFLVFHIFYGRLAPKIWQDFPSGLTLFAALAFSLLTSRLTLSLTGMSQFAAPLALPGLLLATMAPAGLALATGMFSVLGGFGLLGLGIPCFIANLAAVVISTLLVDRESSSLRVMVAAVAGALAGLALLVVMPLGERGVHFSWAADGPVVGFFSSLLTSGLVVVLLGSLFSRLAGGIPPAKIRRLLDLDHPLLKELAEKTPGTFQHTMALANMAEQVAQDIGANAELARVGTYYHDIGKMRNPTLFIENQEGENPHIHLKPEESAARLRAHISDGVALARAANLPRRIIDFIIEHHGTSLMDYFYDLAARSSDTPPNPVLFRYNGRNPRSRETAILMVADSVEAASRTLREPTSEEIAIMVRRITFDKIQAGLLDDSGLTPADIKRLLNSLIRIVHAQFHLRIPYPWQRKSETSRISRPHTDPHLRVAVPVVDDSKEQALEVGALSKPPQKNGG
jgi:putative nucleotidyltransferase with HDIG domain